jgi:DNA-binding Lrp family transcriptional regulator
MLALKWVMIMTDIPLTAKVIEFIQGDVPTVANPFAALAVDLGCSEADIIEVIKDLKMLGVIRRYGAVLRHQQAGYTVNAMVAWQVPQGHEDALGTHMATYRQVSHCYCRQVPDDFPYQLFSMIHARSEAELDGLVQTIAEKTGIEHFLVLSSVREFKKVSMKYHIKADFEANKEDG